mmetsp:Transcript_7815/g.17640  ORF Transcript_7815/g.17640 Transcript_7815/m.17640 type:complete len:292 (+) Transcript_7815:115-990(+)
MSSNSKHSMPPAAAALGASAAMVAPSISDARELPMSIVNLRTVKIGEEVYTLDRDILVPRSEKGVASRPTKKGKTVDYYLEIKWENYNYDDGQDTVEKYSMFADEIPNEGGFSMSRVFQGTQKSEEGEEHQHGLTFCFVDSKSEDRKVLVEIDTSYWTVPVNLMHFNQASQDLANFCRYLWKAADRDANDYSDMAIEFGSSPYSGVEISTLVEEATGVDREHVMYISGTKMSAGASSQDSLKLLRMIFTSFPASVISYEVDLKALGISEESYATFGFEQLGYDSCFVGPTC